MSDVLVLESVDVDRATTAVLRGVSMRVRHGERWAILGPNGSGKTTMLELAAGYLHPTRGVVEVLGGRLGTVDVRVLRERVALVSSAVAGRLYGRVSAADLVLAGARGALEPWWHDYSDEERSRAASLLAAAGFAAIADRPFAVLSEGERKQVLLARSLMGKAELVLLDEPAAGLDVGGRERLVRWLGRLAADPASPPTVLVTHHVEEIPPAFTHLLLLRSGEVVVSGPLRQVLSSENLSSTFGLDLVAEQRDGRYACRAR